MPELLIQGGNTFSGNKLPQLLYICQIHLDEEGQPPHSHNAHAELMLIRRGMAVVEIDGIEETLGTGDFVLCDAGKVHSFRAEDGEAEAVSCGLMALHCRGMEENCFIEMQAQPVVHAGIGSRVLDDILTGLERAQEDPDTRNAEARSYLTAAAVVIALQLHELAAVRAERAHFDLGTRTKLFLDQNYLHPLTLDEIAQKMGVSKYHLDRIFFKTVNCTPMQYITRRRMARAQTLLASTGDTVQSIAAQCGYSNYNYFTVLFRKTTGKTPREYRKMIQGRAGG